MTQTVDLQISPGHADWPLLLESTQAAESAGFGVIWVFDHLAGRSLRGESMLECFTWLGALASATDRIELGSLVTNVWNRELGVLAVAAASVTAVGSRQFHLGIGAGTSPRSPFAAEQTLTNARLGDTVETRHTRVVEALELFASMWDPDRDDAMATFPLPSPRPLVTVGVNSERLSRLAGRLADGINIRWEHDRRDQFIAAADDELLGRNAAERRQFSRSAWAFFDEDLLDAGHPDRVAMTALGIDRLILTVLDRPDPNSIGRCVPN